MIYVLASFKKEIGFLLDIVKIKGKKRFEKRTYYNCELDDENFYVVKAGVGQKSVPKNTELFKDCSLILSTGFCGALVSDLKNGDLVISKSIISISNKDAYNSIIKGKKIGEDDLINVEMDNNREMIDRFIEELTKEKLNVGIFPTFTSPKIVRNKLQKNNLHKITGAYAVDMEDIYRFNFAKQIGAEFLSVRAVLDEISDDVPGFADGFKMGQKLTGIISKMDRSAQAIAVAVEKFIKVLSE